MDTVLVPIRAVSAKLDNEDPAYVFGAPNIYLTLALSYEALAAPGLPLGADGVFDPDYARMRPALALSWDEEPDGHWLVRLRPGVRSHAGNEFNAADLAWALQKAYATDTLGAWRWRDIVGVEEIEVLDRHTVRYRLRAPYPTFPNWLLSVTPNVADSASIRQHASHDDPWGFCYTNTTVAGFGPYRLDHADDQQMRFSRRDDYWRDAPAAKHVELRCWPDRASAIAQLNEKRPVVIIGTSPDETVALRKRDDLRVLRAWAGHTSVEIDFRSAPFDDVRVRRALAHATPTAQLMAEGLLGLARPWHSPVKRTSQWYTSAYHHYAYDLRKARALLAEAGHGSGFSSALYLDQRPDCERMAQILAASWRRIGVELTFKDIATTPDGWVAPLQLRTECAHNLSEPIYDIAHDYAAISPIVADSKGPVRVANWTPRTALNPSAVAAYADLLAERDRDRKRRKFDALQKYLVEFCSSIFIAENQHVIVANRAVPSSLLDADSRFLVTLMTQNCSSRYLAAHPRS